MRAPLLAALGVFLLAVPVQAQISPGPLARVHRALDGTTQCRSCHGSSREAMPRLCLDCHKEVAWLTRQRRGFHAGVATDPNQSCGSCHPEHAGRDFDLVAWPTGNQATFDHRDAGWRLEGAHASTECRDCHRASLQTGPAASLAPSPSTPNWVGLETSCASCHEPDTPHDAAVSVACQDCHDAKAWEPAPRFDHDESGYPLSGRHTEVDCAGCHKGAAMRVGAPSGPTFAPLAFGECSSCHRDPHGGAFSSTCSDCHVTRGFSVIDRANFNHGATRYPLLGRHRRTSCDACHGPAMAIPRPAFTRCDACHADAHGGETADAAGVAADCANCHTVTKFGASTFTRDQHDSTAFRLVGSHRTTACASCHTSTGGAQGTPSVTHLRITVDGCATCHADAHGSQLEKTACTTCHGEESWGALHYPAADHADAPLPLDGRHAELECARCHGPSRTGLATLPADPAVGQAGVWFRLPETRCADCHADPHAADDARPDSVTSCGSCHTSTSFRPAAVTVASHAEFAFPLEGAHRAVACSACHFVFGAGNSIEGEATLVSAVHGWDRIAFTRVTGTTCAACHEDPHGGQFTDRASEGRCAACHTSDSFDSTPRFDHDRDAAFALAGAHADVACDRCHRAGTGGDAAGTIYAPVPHRCEDCHTAAVGSGNR